MYFIYTGNAYPHKNLKRLVEAIVLLNKNSEQVIKLKIASSRNIFTQRLQRFISKTKSENLVELLGFVPDEELKILFESALAFVYPSLSEGFGLQGIEAMRAETLLIASDIPVFREVYKDNALYFNPRDFSSIEKSMREVLSMPKTEKEERIKRALEFSKSYSWAKMAKETLRVYQSIN